MAVSTKKTPAAAATGQVTEQVTEQAQGDEVQSIALELAKVKRWTQIGDGRVYEAGIIYEFDPSRAKQLLALVDDSDFPIWMRERPRKELVRKPDPILDTETRHAHRERVAVAARAKAPAPAKPEVKKNDPIHIPDDDPELNDRLNRIDGEDDANPVSV